jgi:hypothetical protein
MLESGYAGQVTINGTALPVVQWSGDFPSDIVVFKNSLVGAHPARASTFADCKVRVALDWDSAVNPFASPISLIQGSSVTNVKLLYNKNTPEGWTITNMIVEATPTSVNIAGKIALSINLAINSGTITTPAGVTY